MAANDDARAAPDLAQSPVPSPCISVCRMSPNTGWCEGCHRTIDEIASWSQLTDNEKLAVWRDLPRRRRLKAA